VFIPLAIEVLNIGSTIASNNVFSVNVIDEQGNIVFEHLENYPSIEAGET